MDELIKGVKIGKIIGKEEKKSDVVKIVGIVLGVLAVVAAIAEQLMQFTIKLQKIIMMTLKMISMIYLKTTKKMKVILWKNKSLCHSEWQVMQICF